MYDNLLIYEPFFTIHALVAQDVMTYLDTKRRRLRTLSGWDDGERGAMILSSHCCEIVKVIWSLDRSKISQEDVVDMLVDHAQRRFELVSCIDLCLKSM